MEGDQIQEAAPRKTETRSALASALRKPSRSLQRSLSNFSRNRQSLRISKRSSGTASPKVTPRRSRLSNSSPYAETWNGIGARPVSVNLEPYVSDRPMSWHVPSSFGLDSSSIYDLSSFEAGSVTSDPMGSTRRHTLFTQTPGVYEQATWGLPDQYLLYGQYNIPTSEPHSRPSFSTQSIQSDSPLQSEVAAGDAPQALPEYWTDEHLAGPFVFPRVDGIEARDWGYVQAQPLGQEPLLVKSEDVPNSEVKLEDELVGLGLYDDKEDRPDTKRATKVTIFDITSARRKSLKLEQEWHPPHGEDDDDDESTIDTAVLIPSSPVESFDGSYAPIQHHSLQEQQVWTNFDPTPVAPSNFQYPYTANQMPYWPESNLDQQTFMEMNNFDGTGLYPDFNYHYNQMGGGEAPYV